MTTAHIWNLVNHSLKATSTRKWRSDMRQETSGHPLFCRGSCAYKYKCFVEVSVHTNR